MPGVLVELLGVGRGLAVDGRGACGAAGNPVSACVCVPAFGKKPCGSFAVNEKLRTTLQSTVALIVYVTCDGDSEYG